MGAWTRTIHSEWTFEVFGEYKDLNIGAASNADQLRIQMTPAFCRLEYRPIEVNGVMLKCDLQTKLMHRITQKIWQEKIQADISEIIGGAVQVEANQHYIRNLYQLNMDIANYYKSFKTNHGTTHHIPHC